VRIGELPVTKKTLKHVRRTVGLVFQDPDDQLFMPLVFDDVAFGPLNLGLGPEEVESQVMKALTAVGAVHLKDRPPYRLSDGEKRAVAIAAVLPLNRPSWSWMSRAPISTPRPAANSLSSCGPSSTL
jgi:cobalt/nickel transport system ATP-binding protein